MAEKEQIKILSENLPIHKKVLLAQVAATPGWLVVLELANEACLRATQDTVKLDPEKPEYERVVATRTVRARNIIEFSDLLFKSIEEHARSIKKQAVVEEEVAVSAVAERFGIHSAKKGEPIDAIKKTFGIHPARPKKEVAK